jgi:hypothetical protein
MRVYTPNLVQQKKKRPPYLNPINIEFKGNTLQTSIMRNKENTGPK